MSKYEITIKVTTETAPQEWVFGSPLVIDEAYEITEIKQS